MPAAMPRRREVRERIWEIVWKKRGVSFGGGRGETGRGDADLSVVLHGGGDEGVEVEAALCWGGWHVCFFCVSAGLGGGVVEEGWVRLLEKCCRARVGRVWKSALDEGVSNVLQVEEKSIADSQVVAAAGSAVVRGNRTPL